MSINSIPIILDRIIGLGLIFFGIWGLFASFKYVFKSKIWVKKIIFLIAPFFMITIGVMLVYGSFGFQEGSSTNGIFEIIFPVALIFFGILFLWASTDTDFLRSYSSYDHRSFFYLLPKISEKTMKQRFLSGGVALIICGLVAIYLFWTKKS